MTQYDSLEDVQFAENPEPRCPCILLLDTSGSMSGAPIAALNHGLQTFKDHLQSDILASRRVEVALVTFNSKVTVQSDFVTADSFIPPVLTTAGLTHMGAAIEKALEMASERKEVYKRNCVAYYRPWIFMITDGAPQGEPEAAIERAASRLREAEEQRKAAFFAVGVQGADLPRLEAISVRQPVMLDGLRFDELFVWLSASMQKVSQSRPDEPVRLEPATGWQVI